MSLDDALALCRAGKRIRHEGMTKGWYVYVDGAGLFAHNPYHGDGPSGRDLVWTPSDADRAANWSAT